VAKRAKMNGFTKFWGKMDGFAFFFIVFEKKKKKLRAMMKKKGDLISLVPS